MLLITFYSASAISTDGIRFYASLNDSGATMYGSSPQKYNGTVTTVSQTNGILENARGDNYGDITYTSVEHFISSEGAVSFWVNRTGCTTGMRLLEKGANQDIRFTEIGDGGCDDWNFMLASSGGCQIAVAVGSGGDFIPLNKWTHLVFTYKSSACHLYVNGTLLFSGTGGGAGSASTSFYIGKYGSGGYNFDGVIDEVMITNYNMTQQNVTDLWNSGMGYNPYLGGGAPPAPTANLTLNVTSDNGYMLSSVNCTLNGSIYVNNTGSWIETNYTADGSLVNITCVSFGFYNETVSNHNSSVDPVNINMTPIGYDDVVFTWTLPDLMVGNMINSSCNYTDLYNYTNTSIWYYWVNVNDSVTYSNQSGNYTIQPVDFQDVIVGYCMVGYLYRFNNSQNNTINQTQIDNFITFNVYDVFSALVADIEFNSTYYGSVYGNPVISYMSTYISYLVPNVLSDINITDLNFFNIPYNSIINISELNSTFNFYMTPSQLVLQFTQDNATYNTSGQIHLKLNDVRSFANWTNSSILIYSQNITEGDVNVFFEMSGDNFTQFYEYYNNGTNNVNEQIEILDKADWYTYVQVMDRSRTPIEDAVVRVYWSSVNHPFWQIFMGKQWKEKLLIGQRMTDAEGKTMFYADSGSMATFYVMAEGYEPKEFNIEIGNENRDIDNPIRIILDESDSGVLDNAWLGITRTIFNKSRSIYATLIAPGRNRVDIQTQYMLNNNVSRQLVVEDKLDRYNFILIPGQHFSSTSNDNITLCVYLDNVLWKNVTIVYDTISFTDIFEDSEHSSIPDNIFIPIAVIGLLIACMAIGIIIKNKNAGTITFILGSILLGIINTAFIWVALIGVLYIIVKVIYKVTSE